MSLVKKYIHHIRLTNWKNEPKYAFYRTINPELTSRTFLNVGSKLGNTMISQMKSHRSFKINSKSIYDKKQCICVNCGTLYDEKHFLLHCPLYAVNRIIMLSKLCKLGFRKSDISVSFLLCESDCDDELLMKIEIITQNFCISTGRVSHLCRRHEK